MNLKFYTKLCELKVEAVHTFFGESKRSRAAGKKQKTKNKNKNLADRKLKFFVTYTKLTGDMAREQRPERETDMADETNGITYFCVYPSNRSWISNESETEPEPETGTGTGSGTETETPLLPSWSRHGAGLALAGGVGAACLSRQINQLNPSKTWQVLHGRSRRSMLCPRLNPIPLVKKSTGYRDKRNVCKLLLFEHCLLLLLQHATFHMSGLVITGSSRPCVCVPRIPVKVSVFHRINAHYSRVYATIMHII